MDHKAREVSGPWRSWSWGDYIYFCMAGLASAQHEHRFLSPGEPFRDLRLCLSAHSSGMPQPSEEMSEERPWNEREGKKPVLRGPRCFVSSFGFEPNWAYHIFLKQLCCYLSLPFFSSAHFLCLFCFVFLWLLRLLSIPFPHS